jgi:hypothetical protein
MKAKWQIDPESLHDHDHDHGVVAGVRPNPVCRTKVASTVSEGCPPDHP